MSHRKASFWRRRFIPQPAGWRRLLATALLLAPCVPSLAQTLGRVLPEVLAPVPTPDPTPTVRLSPRVRVQTLPDKRLTPLPNQVIEPFLTQSVILDEAELQAAARIVATPEGRVLLGTGDRAYARSSLPGTLTWPAQQDAPLMRVMRSTRVLSDPLSGELLGHEAQYIGLARLSRRETTQPATLDIVSAQEEIRVGDRLLPLPAREFMAYRPHAPQQAVDARVVSIHGSAVVNAGQNQVVTVNRGWREQLEEGHVLAILSQGEQIIDKTDPQQPQLQLPDERNGLLMVFRTFEKIAYALVLNTTHRVRVGDHLVNPR